MSLLELYLLGSPEEYIDDFLARISPDIILNMRCLSSSMLYAIEAYMHRQWNIVNTMGRWFRNVRTFLKTLKRCDGIVSGSEAMRFFGRHEFVDSTLDLYVPIHGLLPMGRFLRKQGYKFQAHSGQHPFFDAAVIAHSAFVSNRESQKPDDFNPLVTLYNFVLPLDHATSRRSLRVQLVSVLSDPVEFLISNSSTSESSCRLRGVTSANVTVLAGMMNYLTAQYAVSLFPRTTFAHNTMVICQDTALSPFAHHLWIDRYRSHGYCVIDGETPLPDIPELQCWKRRVGDDFTWVMPYKRVGEWLSRCAYRSWSESLSRCCPFSTGPHAKLCI